ncbi:Asp-tRNA(Asn)/Glu-tRNA(Gln) amidotransferase subunit GatC [Paucilactobacillus nenjiangensis]|jgi:aspartyl-tRNA(Asn)/glutamyl-tRNA(Gln) amidotransferase subunit C|uniref:Aspartyl/glutamyl-tRNA(Asn/Gln) amidotransferase subunit C n=1 Tax=Paucilactobacillus nenjiangensis TaxID=1296540 RepID=A0A5P1X461_9LACO|nr:Asp-tRNA(Asn)/Glu-tRNA(Gln) amidotransferase subunit GatC [Paucilactobacillus nenjiangensis]QER67088.1 Asp-tRNA(Asn)/Glu-tRNA(Gln) amidotransferase subunit GatC [Paucilactobacillus nenjiangensis]
MASQIDEQQVQHVASLAKLKFTDEELSEFTPQLESIIDLFETLEKVDTTGVEPMTSATDRVNVMREDVAVNSHQRDALLKNAPDAEDGYIKVPAIIDESGDAE